MTQGGFRSQCLQVLPPRAPGQEPPLLRHAGLPGLEVLPYFAGSLHDAVLAAAAAARATVVITDLPDRMQRHPGLFNVPAGLLPFATVAVLPRRSGRRVGVPVTPSQPAVVAGLVARQRGLPLRCIDPCIGADPGAGTLPRPRALRVDGDAFGRSYQTRLREAFDAFDAGLAVAPTAVRTHAALRAAVALRAVRRALCDGALLVVEWSLFRLISLLLEGRLEDPSTMVHSIDGWAADQPAELVLLDPERAWAAGMLGDYPALAAEFFAERLQLPGVANRPPQPSSNVLPLPLRAAWKGGNRVQTLLPLFDAPVALDRLLTAATLTGAQGVGLRPRLAFADYLGRRVLCSGRSWPHAATDTLFAAQACGGRAWLRHVLEAILAYPQPPVPPSLLARGELGDLFAPGGGRVLPRSCGGSDEDDEDRERQLREDALLERAVSTRDRLSEFLGPAEGHGIMFAVPVDYAGHELAALAAQRLARRAVRQPVRTSRPAYWPRQRMSIDFRSTLLSFRDHPEGQIYAWHERPGTGLAAGLDTPVVFLLRSLAEVERSVISPIIDGSPAAHLAMRGLPQREGVQDRIYTVVTCVRGVQRYSPHVRYDELTALATLYASRAMGPDRWAQAVARLSRPCRTNPGAEQAWSDWSCVERLVAWALRYGTGRTVAVVTRDPWRASKRVAALAAAERKHIQTLSLATLPPALVDRMTRMCMVSATLRNHPRFEHIGELVARGD